MSAAGVAEDRRLLLLRADGAVVTMRKFPELVRVLPDLDLATGTLAVTLPDGTVWLRRRRRVTSTYGRVRVGLGWDEGPVSVLGGASAAAVTTPPDGDHDGLSTSRYRMLIEVEGSAPFEEDSWVGGPVRIGQVRVRVTHALERCVVIITIRGRGRRTGPD